MNEYLTLLQQNVWMAFIGIILLSYLLEDLAIITAAILASQDFMPSSLALLAIFIGIASGDVLLYGLGHWAKRWRGLRYRLLTLPYLQQAKRHLNNHAFVNIFIIRFIPGLRSISFTLCGYLDVSFSKFLSAVLVATAIWTLVVFSLIYQLGNTQWLQQSSWKWLLGPLALLVLFIFNRYSAQVIRPKIKGKA